MRLGVTYEFIQSKPELNPWYDLFPCNRTRPYLTPHHSNHGLIVNHASAATCVCATCAQHIITYLS
jgi:hypothetical protein